MGEWTKGRIKQHLVDDTALVDESGAFVATTFINEIDYRENATRREADAARIFACWNAMTGIPDPAATMKEVVEVAEKLAAVRIERAIPEVEATDPWPDSRVLVGYDGWELTVGDVRRARALLAKLGRG